MDNLSKLGFLTAEILLQVQIFFRNIRRRSRDHPGNASSSESDEKHQASIRDRNKYFPSPSVFVYTIPNIMVAEIAIRHKVKGENAVLILEQFDPGFIYHYVSELFRNQQVSCCLTGWVECYGDHYQSFLFIVEQEDEIKGFKALQEYVILNTERGNCLKENQYDRGSDPKLKRDY
jgi:hypothetical protein